MAFLAPEPLVNLFLLDLLDRRGLGSWTLEEWYGAFEGRTLTAAALFIGRMAPGGPARLAVASGDPAACALIGERARHSGPVDMMIGPRAQTDALWWALEAGEPSVFYNQRMYLCEAPPEGPGLPLRPARPDELRQLMLLSAEMMAEDLGVDPLKKEPGQHAMAVRSRIEEGRTLIGEQDGEIVFVLDVGTRRPEGAQVGGTYVPPRARRKGIATRGMRSALRRLLVEHRSVSLHVNEANFAAVRCYERAGFERGVPFRLLIR